MSIELLKVKFGERQLHDLDVMAKDMAESKRINALVRQEMKGNTLEYNFNMNVISRLFWPKFSSNSIESPPQIQEYAKKNFSFLPLSNFIRLVRNFSQKFSKLKQGRSLQWLSTVGTTTVELQLEDRTLSFTVNPEYASTIFLFHERSEFYCSHNY